MEHQAGGFFETSGSGAGVSVETTYPLNEQIDGSKVGDEVVGIDINRLLHDLGRDEEGTRGPMYRIFPKEGHPFFFIFQSLPLWEAGVNEAPMAGGDGGGEVVFDFTEGFLSKGDGVADDDDVCSREDLVCDVLIEGARVGGGGLKLDRRWRGRLRQIVGKVLRVFLSDRDFGDQGVGLSGGGFGGAGSRDEFSSTSRGERGRKDDHGRTDLEEVFHKPVDEG